TSSVLSRSCLKTSCSSSPERQSWSATPTSASISNESRKASPSNGSSRPRAHSIRSGVECAVTFFAHSHSTPSPVRSQPQLDDGTHPPDRTPRCHTSRVDLSRSHHPPFGRHSRLPHRDCLRPGCQRTLHRGRRKNLQSKRPPVLGPAHRPHQRPYDAGPCSRDQP